MRRVCHRFDATFANNGYWKYELREDTLSHPVINLVNQSIDIIEREKQKLTLRVINKIRSSQDIQEFLDNAVHGAIYFSLGSNLQTHQLPAGPLTALYNALGSLKQRVLWKHAGDMAIHPGNIKFAKWVPQQAVLGKVNPPVHGSSVSVLSLAIPLNARIDRFGIFVLWLSF